MSKNWTERQIDERAILAVASDRWIEFHLDDLPFLGPFRPAGLDTVRLSPNPAFPDARLVRVFIEDGDTIELRDYQPTELHVARPATPLHYAALSFRAISESVGPGDALSAGEYFWAIPYTHGPSCRLSPRGRHEWVAPGDTVVFLTRVGDGGRTTADEVIFKQWTVHGPYPTARGVFLGSGATEPPTAVALYEALRN